MSPPPQMSHLIPPTPGLGHQPSMPALQDVASFSENSLAAYTTTQSVASRGLSRAATATSMDEMTQEAEQEFNEQLGNRTGDGIAALQDVSMHEDVATDGGDSMDDDEEQGASPPKKRKTETASRAGKAAAPPKKRPAAAAKPGIIKTPKKTGTPTKTPKTPTTPPKKAEAKTKESKVDSSTAFDKSWFKTGGPKYYGCATVYVCKKLELYRIKPSTASRKDHKIILGRTPAQQQEQWAKVMAKVIECTKECM